MSGAFTFLSGLVLGVALLYGAQFHLLQDDSIAADSPLAKVKEVVSAPCMAALQEAAEVTKAVSSRDQGRRYVRELCTCEELQLVMDDAARANVAYHADDQNPDAFVTKMKDMYRKCRMFSVKGFFERELADELIKNYTSYISDIANEAVWIGSGTTLGEGFSLHEISDRRWEILLPFDRFNHPDMLFHPILINFLSEMLGPAYKLHSFGAAHSLPFPDKSTAMPQHWHRDEEQIFGKFVTPNDHLYQAGQAELPPYVVTVIIPLIDIAPELGRTEFDLDPDITKFTGESDEEEDEEQMVKDEFKCIPAVGKGDLLVFDYLVIHRGGCNRGDIDRPLLYMTFSRPWYQDYVNFERTDVPQHFETLTEEQLAVVKASRFAAPVAEPEELVEMDVEAEIELEEKLKDFQEHFKHLLKPGFVPAREKYSDEDYGEDGYEEGDYDDEEEGEEEEGEGGEGDDDIEIIAERDED